MVIIFVPLGKWVLGLIDKLWQGHFETETLQTIAAWLRTIPGKYRRGLMRRYRQQVIIDHEVFNVRGMGLIAAHTLKH